MQSRSSLVALALVAAVAAAGAREQASPHAAAPLFADAFESGLDRWQILGEHGVALRQTNDSHHGAVLELTPNGDDVAVLIRGSEGWSGVRVEGDMLFPTEGQSYLGLLYNHTTRDARRDFGLVYVKGNDSYLQVNPHRDLNVSRLIYPELHVPLVGPSAVTVGSWQHFAFEVMGPAVHVYVGRTAAPQLTFDALELEHGAVGLQPRSVGAPVWVDNVSVTRIDRLTYAGPPIPDRRYSRDDLLTDWQIAGPFAVADDRIARRPDDPDVEWSPFPTDQRGAVVTARAVDFHGPRRVAYFRTTVEAGTAGPALLDMSSADDLAVWVNGRFSGFYARQPPAWFDFDRTPDRAGRAVPVSLRSGRNDIVLRAVGGVYASGGFFARLARQDRPAVDELEAVRVRLETTRYQGREAVRLIETRERGGGLALLKGVEFRDGTIEVDVAGRRGPGAVPDDRGFIGIAFRVRPGATEYECIYLRPDNGRATDQIRRNHSTQYVAYPDFGFARLRQEAPEKYESYVDLEYGAWTRMRLEVSGTSAQLFVHDAPQPALVVNDLKLGTDGGGVALWIGAGTDGYFSNLRVR